METEPESIALGLVENEELENPEEDAGMEVAHYRVQQDSDNLDSDQVSVVMETPPSSKNIFLLMFEAAKKTWSTFTRDTKRAILAIMGLGIVLAIVVIATVSKSASIQSPKAMTIWEDIRLPTTVVPSHYNVTLKIDMTNERFTGSEDVFVDISETTSVLLIHINNIRSETEGYEMNVTDHSVHRINDEGEESSGLKVKHAFPYSQNSFFVIKMNSDLQPGSYKLYFEWESRLVRGLDGIYISSYEENGVQKKVLASQMEPLAARKVMPCFDEPKFKANFSMTIEAEKIYPVVLWNMPVKKEVDVDSNWKKYTFDTSVKMSTYLLAFIVADFKCTDPPLKTTNGVEVRTCGRKGPVDAGEDTYSAEKTKVIIEEYEKFYGTKFPLPKIDSVAVPDFSAGAMENWGLILYRETALLYNPNKDTYSNKARVNTVVAHELAHQWFGNLVTMKWWNDLWLNEGFASYVEWIGTDKSEPHWNYTDFQTYSDKSRAFAIDSYTSSRPTSIAVSKPDDITAQFDSISYSKGSAMLVQAKMFMDGTGKDTENFETAIRNYIEKYQYSNAEQSELCEELNKVYNDGKDETAEDYMNIVEVMNTWTLQMNFPVVDVRRYDDNHVIISQRRFLISDTDVSGDKDSPYGYQWYVPIEYKIGASGDIKFQWLKPHSTVLVPFDFEDKDNFLRLNMNSAGYYVVNYSHDLRSRLNNYLDNKDNYKKLTTPEAQGMLYDTFLLISEGSTPMSEGLNLIDMMLKYEDRLVPLREISRQISGVAKHISENEGLNKKWKNRYQKVASDLYKSTEASRYFKSTDDEEDLPTDDVEGGFQDRLKVVFAVNMACAYGVQECVDIATAKFDNWNMETGDNEPKAEFKATVMNTVMSKDVTDEVKEQWAALWGLYTNPATSASEKQTIYYALGLIQDEDTLWKFSDYCLDSSLVRPSDALYILGRSIAQTRLGRHVSLEFLKANWTRITEEFTDALFAVDAYVAGVLSDFSEKADLDDIQEFFADKLDTLGPGRAAYESALQSIRGNIAWREEHESAVEEAAVPSIWEDIRLPTNVVPSHYDVKLKIDMTNERFTGSEYVFVEVHERTSVLLIHINNVHSDTEGYEMNVTDHSVHQALTRDDGTEYFESRAVKEALVYPENNYYVMKMDEDLEPGSYKLYFEWESRLVRGLDGIYISSYEENGVQKKVLASQMEPLAARKVMPCFDEPNFKANFSMEITAEKIYPVVLWNMPVKTEKDDVDNSDWKTYTFDTSVKMSTYLLAFIVADFKCTEPPLETSNGVKVRTCGRKEPVDDDEDKYSAQITKTIIEKYEEFYGTQFPLPKIDSVAVPDFSAGAMENWGLILYRETALLYNPNKDTYSNKARVNTVVAHELAHQWFGNLVTMKWWNDLWLNEGFASYVEWIGTVKSEPNWDYLDFQTYSDKSRAFAIDSYTSSRPTSIAVSKPDDINAQFDSISYSKGSAMLVQAKMFMDGTGKGTENFENAIKKYVEVYQYSNAEQSELYEELSKVYNNGKDETAEDYMNIVEVMNTWTLQMNFPVIDVRRYDDNHVIISQRRFLISDAGSSGDKKSPYGYQWYVPIEYKIGDGDIEFLWLKPNSTELIEFDFSDADNYLRLNMMSAGYYVVNFNYDLNSRLLKYLDDTENYKNLTTSEAQGMMYDTFLLISEGSTPMSEGLNLIDMMLKYEDRLVPLREISRQISGVAVHISENEDLWAKWKNRYKTVASDLYGKTEASKYFKSTDDEEELPTDDVEGGFQNRLKVVFAVNMACAYGVEECVDIATAKFDNWNMETGENEPKAEFKATIMNTVMSKDFNEDVKKQWDALWGLYTNPATSASEKQTIYNALGLIQNNDTLIEFSNYCLDSTLVRPSDALYILGRSIAQTRLGRHISWDFLKANWARITEEFTDALFAVDSYIAGVLSNFSEQKKLDEIEEFFADKLDTLGPGRAAYESALQSIRGNIAWREEHESAVEEAVAE